MYSKMVKNTRCALTLLSKENTTREPLVMNCGELVLYYKCRFSTGGNVTCDKYISSSTPDTVKVSPNRMLALNNTTTRATIAPNVNLKDKQITLKYLTKTYLLDFVTASGVAAASDWEHTLQGCTCVVLQESWISMPIGMLQAELVL